MGLLKTRGIKYIGSKFNLIPSIMRIVELHCRNEPIRSVLDVMTGTTRVAQAFRALGCETVTSDLSQASATYAAAFLHPGERRHLAGIVDTLNALEGKEGWLTRHYSGPEVKAWQKKNCMKADAVREYIEEHITDETDKRILIAALIMALDKVDNTVGVQAAFLKNWCTRSYTDLVIELPQSLGKQSHSHIQGDCLSIPYPQADLAYVDPPYSWHSYSVYYNLYDTIALWDYPDLVLTTNRRKDRYGKQRVMKSPWNSPKTVCAAFQSLLQRLPVTWIVVSYSKDAILRMETLCEMCSAMSVDGKVHVYEIDYKKHNMTAIGNGKSVRKQQQEEICDPHPSRTTECVLIFKKNRRS